MTPLVQTALDFCIACLGWEDVREDGIGLYVYSHPDRPEKLLHYGDLNSVMEAVLGWCAASGSTLVVTSQHPTKMFRWRVQVSTRGYTLDNDLCHALLAACVEASRKLKGGPPAG